MKKNDKNETVDTKSDDTEIGKLVGEIVKSGEPEQAEAVDAVYNCLLHAKRLAAIVFGPDAANDHTLVLGVYDRIIDQTFDEGDDDDADDDDDEAESRR